MQFKEKPVIRDKEGHYITMENILDIYLLYIEDVNILSNIGSNKKNCNIIIVVNLLPHFYLTK